MRRLPICDHGICRYDSLLVLPVLWLSNYDDGMDCVKMYILSARPILQESRDIIFCSDVEHVGISELPSMLPQKLLS